MPEQRVSLNTIGGSQGRKGVSTKNQAAYGSVSFRLGGGGLKSKTGGTRRNPVAKQSAQTGRKTSKFHRVGSLGSGSAGGNPRSAGYSKGRSGTLGARHRVSAQGRATRATVSVSKGLGKIGTRNYASRGVVGYGRVSIGLSKSSSSTNYSGGRGAGKTAVTRHRQSLSTHTASRSVKVRTGVRVVAKTRMVAKGSSVSSRKISATTVKTGGGSIRRSRSHKVW